MSSLVKSESIPIPHDITVAIPRPTISGPTIIEIIVTLTNKIT